MMYQRILLPIDGSEHSLRAVEHAIRLARLGGEVIILTITEPIPAIVGGEARREAEKQTKEESRALLAPVLERFKDAGLNASTMEYPATNIGNGILYIMDQKKCDIIIMGSRGRSEIEGLFLGSVTHRVLDLANVPVLVVN